MRPNRERAQLTKLLLLITIAVDALSFTLSFLQWNNVADLESSGTSLSFTGVLDILSIISLILLITTGVVFIMWFRRAYYNLHQLVDNLNYSEGWAAGGWFVPIISLWYPYVIMKDLFTRSKHILKSADYVSDGTLSLKWVNIWWLLWVLSNVYGTVSSRMQYYEMGSEYFMSELVNFGLSLGAGIFALKVVSEYAKIEHLLAKYEEGTDQNPALSSLIDENEI